MKQYLGIYTKKSFVLCMALVCSSLMAYAQSGEWVPQNIFEGGSTNIFESNPQGSLLLPSDSNLFNGPGRLSRDSSLNRSIDPNLYGNSNPGGPGGGGGGPIEDAGVPVDGGLSVMLAIGAAMGLRKRARRKDAAVK